MKKIILASLCLTSALSFTGCVSEEDDIFDASAPVRLEEAAKTYTERLAASAGGWAMEYYPTEETSSPKGNGYLLLAKFNPNLSDTVGMKNQFCTPANQYMEDTSSWEVITDNGPVLTFDTYNKCIHTFSSPEDVPSTSTDETGVGLEGDYEFVMIDVPEDGEFVMLKGKKRGMYVRMTRLDEGTDFNAYIDDVLAFTNEKFPSSAPNTCLLTMGDSVMRMANASTGIPNIYPYNGDPISDESYHPFMITKRGGNYYLRFRDTYSLTDGVEEQEFVYDAETDMFHGVENPEFTITGDDPKSFLFNSMALGNSWTYDRTSGMSDDMMEKYNAVRTDFTQQYSYSFNGMTLTSADGQIVCTISYRTSSGGTVSANYNLTTAETEDGLTISGYSPNDNIAQNILNLFGSLGELFDAMNGTYTVSGTSSNFNLSTLRLEDNAGKYFELKYN